MKKLQILDLLRGFSILSVLAVHLQVLRPSPSNAFLKTLWEHFSIPGFYGVTIFFVISGFLITRLIDQNLNGLFHPDIRGFYTRRAARILPLLGMITIIGWGFIHFSSVSTPQFESVFHHDGANFDGLFWVSIAAFCFNWFRILREHLTPLVGLHWDVLWSLSIEEQFYLCFPLALVFLKNQSKLAAFLASFIILGPVVRGIAFHINPYSFLLVYTNSFACFDSIACGSLLYLAVKEYSPRLSQNRDFSAFLCGSGALIILAVYAFSQNNHDLIWGPTQLNLGTFLFLLGGIHLPVFESKFFLPFALPGKVSYGMYLWHGLVLYLLWPLIFSVDVLSGFALYAAGTFAFSYLSYRFYELPMNGWVRKTLGYANKGKQGNVS